MDIEFGNKNPDISERRLMLIMGMLVVSAIVHTTLMFFLQDCSFAPVAPEVHSDRKWSKDVPVMEISKLVGDPLALKENLEARPAAAPVTLKEEERVEQFQGVESSVTPPTVLDSSISLPANESVAQSPLPDVAKLQPRQEILQITKPVVPDSEAALPRVVVPDLPRVKVANDITPAFDLMDNSAHSSLSQVSAPSTTTDPGIGNSKPLVPALAPPSISDDLELLGLQRIKPTVAPITIGGSPTGSDAAKKGSEVKKDVAEQIQKIESSVQPAPLPTAVVDEKLVQKEKEAVRVLRDEENVTALPFDKNVNVSLGQWIDRDHPQFKYFHVRISSKKENPLPVISKDIVFLLDASGSIGPERLISCRSALREELRKLNSGDRFNIVAFRDKFQYAFTDTAWRAVDSKAFREADEWISDVTAHGNTDVFRTLRSVLNMPRDPARPIVALVITDGVATSGLTRNAEIISRFTELNGGLISIYMYGVRKDANQYLMDMLTRASRGSWTRYTGLFRVRSASGLGDFTAQYQSPVLSDISAVFSSSSRADVYPKHVANLCEGQAIDIYGMCPADQKELVFSVRGLNGAKAYESFFRLPFSAASKLDSDVKREWAQRRLYAMVAAYTMHPNKMLMDEMHKFAKDYKLDIPYERELKK